MLFRSKADVLRTFAPWSECMRALADNPLVMLRAELAELIVGGALDDLGGDAVAAMVLAYEPVWAIGTGATATAAQAEEVHALIRGYLAARPGAETAAALRIQYGGSVKPENAAELFAQENIDGGLIGGAALAAESFAAIVKAAL